MGGRCAETGAEERRSPSASAMPPALSLGGGGTDRKAIREREAAATRPPSPGIRGRDSLAKPSRVGVRQDPMRSRDHARLATKGFARRNVFPRRVHERVVAQRFRTLTLTSARSSLSLSGRGWRVNPRPQETGARLPSPWRFAPVPLPWGRGSEASRYTVPPSASSSACISRPPAMRFWSSSIVTSLLA